MISVNEALDQLFALVAPLSIETVPLVQAYGRTLAQDVSAVRDQPPFAASAMDGYAVAAVDVAPGARFTVIGEAAAGHAFAGSVAKGEAARIFTGAPLPEGTDRVIIQEDVIRDGNHFTISDTLDEGYHVRPAGADFMAGAPLAAPRVLSPSDIALLAAMNIAQVPVTRRPVVALIATGDELVQPGETPGPDQIIASNSYGLAALMDGIGAETRMLPIARDRHDSLALSFELAQGADLIVTIGGASVGDYDLVGTATEAQGMDRAFYKVAMRPGKPLLAGRIGKAAMIGLPGNPVSAMVCGHIFLVPVLRRMLGLGDAAAPRRTAVLSHPLAANGPREHYMRAILDGDQVTVCARQDSSLLSVLVEANALVVRPVDDGPRQSGEQVSIITL